MENCKNQNTYKINMPYANTYDKIGFKFGLLEFMFTIKYKYI